MRTCEGPASAIRKPRSPACEWVSRRAGSPMRSRRAAPVRWVINCINAWCVVFSSVLACNRQKTSFFLCVCHSFFVIDRAGDAARFYHVVLILDLRSVEGVVGWVAYYPRQFCIE